MGWVVILLPVVMYVYAVLGATLFSETDPMHFRDLGISFLTAANVATINDWRTYLMTTMYGCEHFGCDASWTFPDCAVEIVEQNRFRLNARC
jgi:hypothetical protein